MTLCAAAFSYSLDFWYRRLNRKWLLGVGFCFYAFLPTIALFSVSTTKDVVCSLALFIAFHLLYELYENTEGFFRKKEKIAALSCSLIVGALYRKNVIYAVFLYLVLCAVFCKKQKRKIISLFAGKILILTDPMLATGSSMELAYEALLTKGEPSHIHIASVIASRQAIEHIKKVFPTEKTTVWCGAIDPELNAHSYIVPGLGD
jgi:hypothetical protein